MAGKFNNRRTVVDGITFDSKGEASRYVVLKRRADAGEITNLETQASYRLEVNGQKIAIYRADFRYLVEGVEVVEDFKSPATVTPTFKLKAKLMKAIHGIDILITMKADHPITAA